MLSSLAAQAAPLLEIDTTRESQSLAQSVDILADPGREFDIQDVSRAPLTNRFRPARRGDLNLDFSRADYWLRFTLHNPNNEQHT
ncbi:MAG: 7TM-DISM domain-containing protein, partial [Oceanisphaera sp.]|nr:7TM-DISM domain-containing protein [Oceanisphaera sp.]